MRGLALLALISGVMVFSATAADWPRFRGDGTGVSGDKKIPVEWSPEKNIAWKAAIPGVGWSSPIVWGDKVFVTTASSAKEKKPSNDGGGFGKGGFGKGGFGKGGFGKGGFGKGGFGKGGSPPDAVYKWELLCFDRKSGELLWKKLAVEKKPTIAKFSSNSYASETPVTDGQRIYAYFGMTGVFCFDLAGNQLWKKDIGSYPMMNGFGTGSSPVLVDDKLIIQCDNEEKSFLIALNAKTGEQIWNIKREEQSSWATPFVWHNSERTEIVTSGSKVRSYNPADGALLWEMGGMVARSSASPVANKEILLIGGGGGMAGPGPLFAIKPGAKNDISLKSGEKSSRFVAWVRDKAGPTMASPLLYQGFVYVLDQRGGFVNCYYADSGKIAYIKERLSGARGFTSSPWAYDGKIFCLDDSGTTFVLKAGAEFQALGKNMLKEMFWASPAVAEGSLFLRGVDSLYCIRN